MTMTASSMFALNHHMISPSNSYSGPVANSATPSDGKNKTVSGTIDDMINGTGSFSKTMEEVNGQKVTDKTITFANGKTKSIEKTVALNADGSKTITRVGANGKTSTIQETATTNADGSKTLTKDKTKANGHTIETTDTTIKSATGGIDHQITRTNAAGQTETLDREVTKTAGGRSVITTGTGYNGNPIYDETTYSRSTLMA